MHTNAKKRGQRRLRVTAFQELPFGGVFELPGAASLPDLVPSIILNELDYFSDFHYYLAKRNYFMGFTPRSLHIFFARWSSISLCLGIEERLPSSIFTHH